MPTYLHLVMAATLSLLFSATGALAYTVYPYFDGPDTVYQEWGDAHAGTPGGVVEWSLIPDGTGVAATYPDANLSGTSQMESIMNDLGYDDALAAIERAFDQWSSVANVQFVQVADSGLPLDDPSANPPETGRIRIGAYPIDAGVGAVGWAPWPFGGTFEGDVLFNANASFYFSPGNEGDSIPVFNDFESLMLHELGHAAIGLDHSDECAVMSADFSCFQFINRELDPDDIAGAEFLYGPAIAGADFDEDGDVDGDDFLAWQSGFGTDSGATHMQGDADADGDVDGDDFLLWQSQFGSSAGSAGASPSQAAVPEPASAMLIGLCGLIVLGFRRCSLKRTPSVAFRIRSLRPQGSREPDA